ncbi:hypothetical protein BLIG_01443 [Bifidobacterium longum subsp. infantis CCUG 52486]|uniref:Uncharacterized protein n=1 Tax=Bifidobacterium longum subsp. infantis CCUG 52486 TaxID=537937 RepID=C5ECG1_BIFLI|nr:hypothetical protein BLIG_01443 [Bifidobacterium longum subsp. infantis CCUG 52486]
MISTLLFSTAMPISLIRRTTSTSHSLTPSGCHTGAQYDDSHIPETGAAHVTGGR